MDNRRVGLWLLFLGGAAVVALIPEFFMQHEDEVALPVSGKGEPASTSQPGGPAADAGRVPERPQPAAAVMQGKGLFSAHSWTVAPPPAPAPVRAQPVAVAAPAPTAPALPYAFLGKLDDAERLRVFLMRDEKIYTVSVGDVIDGTYRVERISASEMVLTYLPLKVTQTLSVGDKL